MKRTDFHFDLPDHLIARFPLAQRTASRLLCLDRDSGLIQHQQFLDLPDLLQPGDLLVFNDTRVIPARLFGQKATGGRVEILIERLQGKRTALAHIRASKSPKAGQWIQLDQGPRVQVLRRADALFELQFEGDQFEADQALPALLDAIGHIPLPPYLHRDDVAEDRERYQTVYARYPGAVAAPTAGLHFDQSLIEQLHAKGIATAYVTLHVGAGTFQSMRAVQLQDHVMHTERFSLDTQVVEAVARTRARGGRVIAVGTTAVRALESASASGTLQAMQGDTSIFIYPGYAFRCVDAMITNFHLPESTLIMLVSAFAGREAILAAYAEAIAAEYRFFSYGDAMFIGRALIGRELSDRSIQVEGSHL